MAVPPGEALHAILESDQASLILIRRATGTEWAFSERAANAPPLANMSDCLHCIAAEAAEGWWWDREDAFDTISAELARNSYSVVDGLLGGGGLAELRAEVEALVPQLRPARLAGGRSGDSTTFSHGAVRGDRIGWFSGREEALWPRGTLHAYLLAVDTIIAQLSRRVTGLGGLTDRSKAMVACYPGGGARYARHCDNSCSAGEGERCNGRRLTAILYLNDWTHLHGGCLRLYAPLDLDGAAATLRGLDGALGRPDEAARLLPSLDARLAAIRASCAPSPRCDVAPLADRLLLFWSDYRTPHEVLPSHTERLAVTLWYLDPDELARAHARDDAADVADAREAAAIEREIARIERRHGGGARRHGDG